MPTITTAETLCGPRPAPNTYAFLRWCEELTSRRRRSAVFRRANTFYIDPDSGNDANNGTSPATPWKSLTPVRTRLTATSGDDAFLFKRGTILRDHLGLIINKPKIHLGAYGPLRTDGLTSDKPTISHFTVRWPAGTTWTLQANGRYRAPFPGSGTNNPSGVNLCGFVRVAEEPLNPLTAVANTTACEATDNSFFVEAGFLHVRLVDINDNVVDPSLLTLEAPPVAGASPPYGIEVNNGAQFTWIDGLIGEGWGCGTKTNGLAYSGGQQNESFIVNNLGDPSDMALADHGLYLSNIESYYDGAHSLSHQANGVGGWHLAENCVAGLAYNGAQGQSTFNSYCGLGGLENIWLNCVERFGPLPQQVRGSYSVTAGSMLNSSRGRAFYGHTGGSTTQSLYLNIGCKVLDERAQFSRATCTTETWFFDDGTDTLFHNTDSAVPSSLRAFVIGYQHHRSRPEGVTTSPYDFNSGRIVFINCRHQIRHTWGTSDFWSQMVLKSANIFLNCIFEIDSEVGTQGTLFAPPTDSKYTTLGPRLLNCMILHRGATNNTTNDRFMIQSQLLNRIWIGNTLVITDRFRDGATIAAGSGKQGFFGVTNLAATNSSTFLKYIATAGCSATDSGSFWGFGNATGYINLDAQAQASQAFELIAGASGISSGALRNLDTAIRSIDPNSPLAGAGHSNPFDGVSVMLPAPEYDFFGRRRPTTPSIGPFDVLNISTGGGGGGGGSGNRGMVRSPVRPAVSS